MIVVILYSFFFVAWYGALWVPLIHDGDPPSMMVMIPMMNDTSDWHVHHEKKPITGQTSRLAHNRYHRWRTTAAFFRHHHISSGYYCGGVGRLDRPPLLGDNPYAETGTTTVPALFPRRFTVPDNTYVVMPSFTPEKASSIDS